ncbi:hypothetical protein MKW94_015341 [Papaver nudicaule]|uniref:Protein SPT2 homolog n=1 Tax=Papaver nudicaule TaxID=74823 RepID=A0AA41V5K9_PAPNU|nr:hypothetical protein [Papaver nudicaule]
MGGYENLDEYEDDGFIDDEEQQTYAGEEEKVQEEARKPTKEEMDFLEVRQKIKETMRRKMNQENPSDTNNSQERKKHNYGSFFGPSEPAIAQRVIRGSKSLNLAAMVLTPKHSLQRQKSPALANAASKPGAPEQPRKAVSKQKHKAMILKDSRDYSFLHSEDAELPAATKVPPPQTSSAPNSESAQLMPKVLKSGSSTTSRPVLDGGKQRLPVSVGHRMQSKQEQHKSTPGGRIDSTPVNHRKQQSCSTGKEPSRNQETKSLPPKCSIQVKPSTLNKFSVPDRSCAPTTNRNVSIAIAKRPPSDMRKTVLPRPHPPMSGLEKPLPKPQLSRSGVQRAPSKSHPQEPGKDTRELDKSRTKPKQPVPCSTAPKVKTPKQLPSRPPAPKDRRRKRYMIPDPDDFQQQIRNMFGYNPSKYGDDGDDSDMEVGFQDIMREEKRSAKIAHKEDERERILIEKEEQEERMGKKRKMSSQKTLLAN